MHVGLSYIQLVAQAAYEAGGICCRVVSAVGAATLVDPDIRERYSERRVLHLMNPVSPLLSSHSLAQLLSDNTLRSNIDRCPRLVAARSVAVEQG